ITISNNESLLEASILNDTDPWTIARTNELGGTWDGNQGDILFRSGENPGDTKHTGLPASMDNVEINPLPLVQGSTIVIKIKGSSITTIEGKMIDHTLHFFPTTEGTFSALQGINALLKPGPYPLHLTATLADGSKQSFEQMVIVKTPQNPYPNDPMLSVDPATIDPAVTQPEIDQVTSITSVTTPAKYWQDMFQLPVAPDYCVKSRFGNRRAYNGGNYDNFHAGLDFGICSSTNPFDIYAPADGVVVYTGKLVVRGNATIIDHGWGVFTGYWHQEDILVNVGDKVTTGQLIGHIGSTGRVTGPHLHWEIWVNGEQVNPTDWLNITYP
ncbi:MAG: M23 family metallopeptidase, partial [Chloroflexota bacterium]